MRLVWSLLEPSPPVLPEDVADDFFCAISLIFKCRSPSWLLLLKQLFGGLEDEEIELCLPKDGPTEGCLIDSSTNIFESCFFNFNFGM
jgi:hypothetical protein